MPRGDRLHKQDDSGRESASEYRKDVDKRGLGDQGCGGSQPLRGPWDSRARIPTEVGVRLCRLPAVFESAGVVEA